MSARWCRAASCRASSPACRGWTCESWPERRSGRAADGEPVDAQRRLADADRHALPFLAANADAGVEPHVVANGTHPRQRVGAVADQRRALDGVQDAAVLDPERLARREHELAASDVDLAAAEVGRVKASFQPGDDLFLRPVAAE